MSPAFAERVKCGNAGSQEAQHNGVCIQLKHQSKSNSQQNKETNNSFRCGNFPGGNRALLSAPDMTIKVAVGKVIDHTTGGTHHKSAQQKYHHNFQWRVTGAGN